MCSRGNSAGVGGWDTEMRCEVGDGRLEEKIFVICWGMGSELKGRQQIF